MSGFDWRDAMQTIDEPRELEGVRYYDLPNDDRLYVGDQFWLPDDRYLISIEAVKTKLYTGHVGGKGREGGDYVFIEPDWTPPTPRHGRSHYTDDIQCKDVESFASQLDNGELVPHRGNGRPRPP